MLEQAYKAGKIEHPHTYGEDFGSPDETLHLLAVHQGPSSSTATPPPSKPSTCSPTPPILPRPSASTFWPPRAYGEIIGGSQRIDSYDLLKTRIEEHHLPPRRPSSGYLDLRRYGSVPHGGFGMGIERAVAWICGLDHVRETIPFARTPQPHLSVT